MKHCVSKNFPPPPCAQCFLSCLFLCVFVKLFHFSIHSFGAKVLVTEIDRSATLVQLKCGINKYFGKNVIVLRFNVDTRKPVPEVLQNLHFVNVLLFWFSQHVWSDELADGQRFGFLPVDYMSRLCQCTLSEEGFFHSFIWLCANSRRENQCIWTDKFEDSARLRSSHLAATSSPKHCFCLFT